MDERSINSRLKYPQTIAHTDESMLLLTMKLITKIRIRKNARIKRKIKDREINCKKSNPWFLIISSSWNFLTLENYTKVSRIFVKLHRSLFEINEFFMLIPKKRFTRIDEKPMNERTKNRVL